MGKAENIVFVCPRFPEGPTIGGAETLLKNLAVKAAAAGRKVTFLSTCAKDHFTWKNELPAGATVIDGIKLIRFPVNKDRDAQRFLSLQSSICSDIKLSRQEELEWMTNSVNSDELIKYLKDNSASIDAVLTGPYLFGLVYHAAMTLPNKTFLVPCLHDESFAYTTVMKDMFESVRSVLFNSEPECILAKRLYGLAGKDMHVVGMGMDPFEPDASRFRRKYGIDYNYFMYSGRRETMKGTPLLIDYINAYRQRTGSDIRLLLTGSGDFPTPEGMKGRIRDMGFLDEQDKHDAMAGATAFCHPSVNESFGIVVLESWLAGTPAIVHSGSEVLKDHCIKSKGGLYFANYPEFEAIADKLISSPDVARTLGMNGKRYVAESYGWRAITDKLFAAVDR